MFLFLCLVNLGHVADEVNHAARVTPLVVVPRDKLDEVGRKSNTSLSIEDGRERAGDEVRRNDLVLSVAHDALELLLGSTLDLLLDLVIGSRLLEANGEVNDGDVGGTNTESHTSKLTLELGDDETDGLSSTRAGRNNVGRSSTARAPVLATLGGTIDGLLSSSDGVDGGHETLLDTPLVVDDLGKGSKAVGGARSVGNNVHVLLVLLVVHTHDEGGSALVLGGSRDDNLLSTLGVLGLKVECSLGGVAENTRGLANVLSAGIRPRNLTGIPAAEEGNLLTIHLERVGIVLNRALEATVDRVVLEHVCHVVRGHEGIVDSNDLNVLALECSAEDEAADASETVDADLDRHL